MNDNGFPRATARACAVVATAMVLIVAAAGPALADTSQATAQAATVQLLGQPLVSTGQVVASSDGTSQTRTGNRTPALSVLGSQTVLTTGAAFQDAVANTDGTSAACAGVVGPNGTVQVGPNQTCLVSGAPTGVVLDLGVAVLRADVITAECTARSDGTTTGRATLANARITDAVGVVTLLDLPVNPAPNTALGVPGVADLVLNRQSTAGAGEISVTALELTLLGGLTAGTQVRLGIVTCGPNALTAPIPLLSTAGVPVAVATLLAVGAVVWFVRRRRTSSPAHA
ncbi:MAG: choice-of-anchor P family protein [Acidimicrobiales bacterium]